MPENATWMADSAPYATWVLYEGGNHVFNNITHGYRPIVADWPDEQVPQDFKRANLERLSASPASRTS